MVLWLDLLESTGICQILLAWERVNWIKFVLWSSSLIQLTLLGMVKSQSWTDGNLNQLTQKWPNEISPDLSKRTVVSNAATKVQSISGSVSDYTIKSSKKNNTNTESLIDFGACELRVAKQKVVQSRLTEVSVLEAFDPLVIGHDEFDAEWDRLEAQDE